MTPAVSIIMPCHNAAVHLPASVGSILKQTFTDWELIAVDDGSSDNTLDWLQTQSDARIRALTQTNQGVSAARNAGLAAAHGNYIAFLDADDAWSQDFLETMCAAVQGRADAVLAYCGWQHVRSSGKNGEPFIPPDYENDHKSETLLARCRWPIHAALTKRSAILAAKGFDSGLKNAEDFALWLRVAIAAAIVRVPKVMAFYHLHDGAQASDDHARAALQHWQAQCTYLDDNPALAAQLGHTRIRKLTLGVLLEQAYARYWKRDLKAARQIFRTVMKQGYGTLRDWKYMLPAWLPESWHQWLIGQRDREA